MPYIKNICHAYRELTEKRKEMEGIQNATIRIGTFASGFGLINPLARNKKIVLKELASEPFILLEEGSLNEPMECFREHGIKPNIQYIVHDDYTIMAMIEKGLGVGILSELILNRVDYNNSVRETDPPLARTIGVVFKDKKILPVASRHFLEYLTEEYGELQHKV